VLVDLRCKLLAVALLIVAMQEEWEWCVFLINSQNIPSYDKNIFLPNAR
jgi:hypothetical protein